MAQISKAGASGTVTGLEDKYVYGRRPTGSYVPRFRNLGGKGDGKLGFLRGYGIQAGAGREGWSSGASEPGLGAELKQRLREPSPWTRPVRGQGGGWPHHVKTPVPDPTRPAPGGIPLLRLPWPGRESERPA